MFGYLPFSGTVASQIFASIPSLLSQFEIDLSIQMQFRYAGFNILTSNAHFHADQCDIYYTVDEQFLIVRPPAIKFHWHNSAPECNPPPPPPRPSTAFSQVVPWEQYTKDCCLYDIDIECTTPPGVSATNRDYITYIFRTRAWGKIYGMEVDLYIPEMPLRDGIGVGVFLIARAYNHSRGDRFTFTAVRHDDHRNISPFNNNIYKCPSCIQESPSRKNRFFFEGWGIHPSDPVPTYRIIAVTPTGRCCDLDSTSPPLPEEPCCMGECCPPPDDSLLKALIKKVDKLSEIIGVDDYPVSVPTSFISKDQGFLGNLIPDFPKDVKSLTQFFHWYVERFDEVIGQFEIAIEIKDADATTPGDQPKGFKLLNIAEALAEMFTLNFQTAINSEALINLAVRTLAETGSDKQQNYVTYRLLLSLIDWAGFKTKDVQADLPLTFTPGKTNLDEILQDSIQKVVVSEFDEKFGLEIDMMRFRKACAILDSVFFRKVNPNGNIKQQIMDYLKNAGFYGKLQLGGIFTS